jgi:hypothetical protein
MVRHVFYSFHYQPDNSRASLVRNMGVIEGNPSAKDNDWEEITKGGDKSIQKWIDEQMHGKSCSVVLIGKETYGRKWINYEIKKSYEDKKGLIGIYIHNLKDLSGNQTSKGKNPFDYFTINDGKNLLSSIIKTYDPPHTNSKEAYAYIKDNIKDWIENAVTGK